MSSTCVAAARSVLRLYGLLVGNNFVNRDPKLTICAVDANTRT